MKNRWCWGVGLALAVPAAGLACGGAGNVTLAEYVAPSGHDDDSGLGAGADAGVDPPDAAAASDAAGDATIGDAASTADADDSGATDAADASSVSDGSVYADASGAFDSSACPDAAACAVSWEVDIYPIFAGNLLNCTLASCHGSAPDAAAPLLPAHDETALYAAMTGYFDTACSKPFVAVCATDVDASAVLDVFNDTTCGPMMPIGNGGVDSADQENIAIWLQCGAPEN